MMMAERAARERDQRDEQHPPRPEVPVRAAEEPDEDRDRVDERVLERERAPARVTQLHARELRGRQLAEHLSKLPLGACMVSFVEALLKLLECQPARLVVAAQLTGDPRPISVGDEQVRNLGHPPIVERSTFAKTDRRER